MTVDDGRVFDEITDIPTGTAGDSRLETEPRCVGEQPRISGDCSEVGLGAEQGTVLPLRVSTLDAEEPGGASARWPPQEDQLAVSGFRWSEIEVATAVCSSASHTSGEVLWFNNQMAA